MPKSSLTQVSSEELSRLYHEQGLTTEEIGQRFGVSGEVVRYRMAQLGIARRGQPWPSQEIRAQLTCDELKRLYVVEGLSLAKIGQRFGVGETTIYDRLKKCGIDRRDLSEATIRYPRHDFSGNLLEKAYLIGFRLGDLWVGPANSGPFSTSISVACASSRQEQVALFETLFSPYGHVAVTPGRKGLITQYSLQCCLNQTFDFLLPKQDCIPQWILDTAEFFVAFLAGYVDAEGSFGLQKDGTSRFFVGSYDVTILHQIHGQLTRRFGIDCPKLRLATPKGSPISGGYKSRNDFWALTIGRKTALYHLCKLLEPHLKHAKRRADMQKVWQNVIRRGIEDSEA